MKQMFTKEQQQILNKNPNVIRCSSKAITYSKEFKKKAVKQYYEEGYSPRMIFEEAGFNSSIVGENRYKQSLSRWKKKYAREGKNGLEKDKRGKHETNKMKRSNLTTKEKMERMEAKIAYLEAENDFLAKLRGLKRK